MCLYKHKLQESFWRKAKSQDLDNKFVTPNTFVTGIDNKK